MVDPITFQDVSKLQAFLTSLFMATLYVGSLYMVKEKYGRDHPDSIKGRFIRVSIASVISCLLLYLSSSLSPPASENLSGSYFHWIGLRLDSSLSAILIPLLLLSILFLGPLLQMFMEQGFYLFEWQYLEDITMWRNYVVAPLSEELVFRGCMMPLLLPSFGHTATIFLAPWFFGLAHLHHAIEQYRDGYYSVQQIAILTLFQAFYTTLFGMLSCFIFLRTGHISSVFVSHSFCNMMGFPDFSGAIHHKHRYVLCLSYVMGLILFCYLLFPLTNPILYGNNLYSAIWST